MNTDSSISDEILMAYADGELDAAQAAHVENAMQHDARIAARVAQHRALRVQLQSGFSAVLAEPIPERLLSSLQAHAAANKVVDLAQVRQSKQPITKRTWQAREWTAMAASLVAGIVLGMYALNFSSNDLIKARDSDVLAQGKLEGALTTQLASAAASEQTIQIGISFRNHAGNYCRSFAVRDSNALAGLACREQGDWRVHMLTQSTAGSADEFRQAGSDTPAAVLALIDQQIAGEPLDAEGEAAAQRAGWQ